MTNKQLNFDDNNINFDDNNINFDDNKNINISFEETKIIIYSERNGRKSNTYIIDWDISKESMKSHLKNLKKKYGCNGTIKTKMFQGENKEVLHLQGELKSEVKEYLISKEIEEDNIEVKV